MGPFEGKGCCFYMMALSEPSASSCCLEVLGTAASGGHASHLGLPGGVTHITGGQASHETLFRVLCQAVREGEDTHLGFGVCDLTERTEKEKTRKAHMKLILKSQWPYSFFFFP